MFLMRNNFLKKVLDKWPGKKLLGVYRFLPIFFCMGAALEYSMINWDFNGKVNFYRTYKKNKIEEKVKEIILEKTSIS